MLSTSIDLKQLSRSAKLELLNALWQDLSEDDEEIEWPAWHVELLEERRAALRDGVEEVLDFDVAMKELRQELL